VAGKPVNEMTKRRRGERDAGRCEAAGSKKSEAYSLESVEDVFELRMTQMPAEYWSKEKGLPGMDSLGFGIQFVRGLVGILVVDARDIVHRGEEDVEELGIEVFATMFGHEVDGVIKGERRFVDPLCGEGIEGIGDRGDPSFYGDRFAF